MATYQGITLDLLEINDPEPGIRLPHEYNVEILQLDSIIGTRNQQQFEVEKLSMAPVQANRQKKIVDGIAPVEETITKTTVTADAPRNFPLEVSWIKKD